MSPIPKREPNVDTDTAHGLSDDFKKAEQAIFAHLRLSINEALEVLEAQPGHYNIAQAMDFRTIEFENGTTISCCLRGWEVIRGQYIIPGLDGLLSARTISQQRGVGVYRPFEDLLPRTNDDSGYINLVNAIHDLVVRARTAAQCDQKRGDGMDND